MKNTRRILSALVVLAFFAAGTALLADSGQSTRIESKEQVASGKWNGYPFREKCDYIMQEVDLRPGDAAVDIGAGDGWWTEKLAEAVGEEGTIHAGEVKQTLVDKMKKRFEDTPQVKPYLCPFDGSGLDENAVDLVFLSKTYHHLDHDHHADYLKHLCTVVKPTGRLVIIEGYRALGEGKERDHAWSPGQMTVTAEEAGWILLRSELITGTQHFINIYAQREIFLSETEETQE